MDNTKNKINFPQLNLPSHQAESIAGPRQALKHIGLRAGMNVADLGCGSGYFTIPAAKIVGDGATVYAVDILRPALDHVKSRARLENVRNIKIIWADLEVIGSTKLAPGAVDVSFISSALYQTANPNKFLEEAKRIVKPHGKLVVFEWETDHMVLGPQTQKRIEEKTVISAGRRLGLKLIDQFKPGKHHYGLVFVK